MIRYWLHIICVLATVGIASCDKDPFETTPEELADRIRANTPTELPPITTKGLNTMGAWIHPQPGSELHRIEGDSFLFVASGVERPSQFNTVSGSCDAFNNFRYLSNDYISSRGIFCRRPEIGDDRRLSLAFGYIAPDSAQISFSYDEFSGDNGPDYWTRNFINANVEYNVIRDDRQSQVISATFSGLLINRAPPYDTLSVSRGRSDVIYGITP